MDICLPKGFLSGATNMDYFASEALIWSITFTVPDAQIASRLNKTVKPNEQRCKNFGKRNTRIVFFSFPPSLDDSKLR